jgi:bifunctional non-homologous end joining protein LigD
MLASTGPLPVGPGWAYEFKWDGVRALAVLDAEGLRLYARSGAHITAAYPELAGLALALGEVGLADAVLDGEMVVLDGAGRPSFTALAERMHVRDPARARQLQATLPVTYLIFDVLSANGTDICAAPYAQRREWLESVAARLAPSPRWLVPPSFPDGPATLEAARSLRLEGVVAKRLDAAYRPGIRTLDWIKIKLEYTGTYAVGGWRSGRRELSALLVGSYGSDGLRYRGRVGGGISAAAERDLLARVAGLTVPRSPFTGPLPRDDARGATYVRPELVVEVRYGNLTPDGRLRFPRFVRLRPDVAVEDTGGDDA